MWGHFPPVCGNRISMLCITPTQARLNDERKQRLARMSRAAGTSSGPVASVDHQRLTAASVERPAGVTDTVQIKKNIVDLVMEMVELAEDGKISIDKIFFLTCEYFGVSRVDIISARRNKRVVRPRQIAMYLARMHTTLAITAIGRLMGHRDHSTILHGVGVIERLLNAGDIEIIGAVETIRKKLGLRGD